MLNKLSSYFIIAFLFTFSSHHAMAQSLTISGKVLGENKQPLIGANVMLTPSKQGAVTDMEGDFKINSLSSGTYTLIVSYVGYKSTSRELQITENTVADFRLQMDALLSEEVVVRAIRADALSPITQKTLTEKDIKKVFNGQDGTFVLETLTPSIQVNSDAGTRFTNYGGMRLRGIDQKRINITLNGVPLNDMMDQGVFFSNFTDITRSVQSVQVQRGVGTSTNGTASYAGSVSYESENINVPEPETTITLLGGSFNTWQGTAELKTGLLENNTAFYTRISKTYSDGFRDHSGTDAYSFFFSGGYFGEKDIIKINGFNGKTRNDLAYTPVPLSLIEQNPRTNVNNPNDIDNFGQSLLQLEHTHIFNNSSTLTSSAYYGAAGGDFPFTYQADSATLASINYPLFNDHFGVMSYFNQKNESVDWTVGVHAYTFLRKNIEQLLPNYTNPYYEDNSTKNELSAFAKATYQIGKFSILGDLQARTVSLTMEPDNAFLGTASTIPTYNWTFLNPKVGVTYEFSPSVNTYFSFGRSGREPNRGDYLGDTQINAGNIDGLQNQDFVKPEFVNDYELGLRLSEQNYKVNVNGFYMDFENEIAPIGAFIPQYFLQLYENQQDSYRAGIELDWQLNLNPTLVFSGNTTFMRSVISQYTPDGETTTFENISTPYSPEVFVNAVLSYQLADWVGLSAHGRYVGKSYTELTNNEDFTLPEYFVANLKLTTQFATHYGFDVELNNIFSEQYYTDGAAAGAEMAFFTQAPAHVYCTFTAKF